MLKARIDTPNGQPLLMFGLSGENIARLAAGEPIFFDLAELGIPHLRVSIFYGRHDDDLETACRGIVDELNERMGGKSPQRDTTRRGPAGGL